MATQYRYLFADLITNDILAELPLTGVSFTQVLNSPGSMSGHILLSDLRELAYDITGSTIPARTALYIDRDGVLVWGGIVWARTYNNASQQLEFNAREFISYFERRRISINQAFNNIDQLTVAQTLVNTAQSAVGGNIGIQVGANTSGVLVSRVYYGYELKDLYSGIKDLATADNGFDVNIDVEYDSNNEPIKILRTDYPYRGTSYDSTSPTALVFELPGNIVDYEYPEDGSVAANIIYGIGPGSNEGKLIVSASIPAQITNGWPLLEDTTTYNDTYDQNLLQNLTGAEVTAKQDPVVTIKIVLPPYEDPVLGSYKTGDQCLLRITDDRFPANGSGYGLVVTQRIVAINVEPGENGPERVTLTLADPTN
jgi:hypothetical protein